MANNGTQVAAKSERELELEAKLEAQAARIAELEASKTREVKPYTIHDVVLVQSGERNIRSINENGTVNLGNTVSIPKLAVIVKRPSGKFVVVNEDVAVMRLILANAETLSDAMGDGA